MMWMGLSVWGVIVAAIVYSMLFEKNPFLPAKT